MVVIMWRSAEATPGVKLIKCVFIFTLIDDVLAETSDTMVE